jgi:hypothetical protein
MIYTRYTDVTDFMNEEGETEDLSPSAIRIVVFMRSMTGWVTARHAVISERTNVTCLRITSRDRCLTEVNAYMDPEDRDILYMCPRCGDNGVIRGWDDAGWDRSGSG